MTAGYVCLTGFLPAMVAVAGIRWRIEECNEQGKDLIGLDQHQVRTWTAFHHHVAVCLFAHPPSPPPARRSCGPRRTGPPAPQPREHTGENGHPQTPAPRRQPTTTSGAN